MKVNALKRLLFLLSLFASAETWMYADAIFSVNVNTAASAGSSGYLDFQVGRGPGSEPVTVTIQNLVTDGTLNNTSIERNGAVTGTLPNPIVIANSTQFNDYFQGFRYGTAVQFTVTFSGVGVNAPSGTATSGTPFVFGLYDANQLPIGTNDGNGNSFRLQLNPTGTITSTVFNPAVTIASAVPEPNDVYLVGSGLLLCGVLSRRLGKRAR